MKQFLFMYPTPEYMYSGFDFNRTSDEIAKAKRTYSELFNMCIDERYRQNGFKINYANFTNHHISDLLVLQKEDSVIDVKTVWFDLQSGDPFIYPDENKILDSLGPTSHLTLAGYHLFDCVDKVARRAHERGIDVLVDEDLTQFFLGRIDDEEFDIGKYKGLGGFPEGSWLYSEFMNARKNRPWLWRTYENKTF